MSLAQSHRHVIDVQLGCIGMTSHGSLIYTSSIPTYPFV